MIHYIIACKDRSTYNRVLAPTFQDVIKPDNALILEEGEDRSIFKKYNDALGLLAISDEDVVVFLHDDISICDVYFEKKIEMYFEYRKKVGIAGVIGTNSFSAGGGWWLTDRNNNTRGRIIQGFDYGAEHVMEEQGGMDDSELVSVDGCILFMRGQVAKTYRFDEETYSGYHFYDVDSCFELLQMGWDVGIIDVAVKHESEGPLDEQWFSNRDKFKAKWEKNGITFPVTLQSFT